MSGHVPEPLRVDGMLVTPAPVIPDDAFDLTDYKPTHEPSIGFRRYGRGRETASEHPVMASGEASELPWAERLRRQLAKGHPADIERELRCERAHRLLWLVRSQWGLVPVTHTSDEWEEDGSTALTPLPIGGEPVRRLSEPVPPRRLLDRFHGEDIEPGRPRTLREWPEGQPLPTASCPCHAEVVLTAAEARKLRDTPRRTVLYRRSGPTL